MANVRAGESVLLLGGGPIAGTFAAEISARGATASAFSRNGGSRAMLLAMGADTVFDGASVADDHDVMLAGSPDGRGYDLVVECAGAAETTAAAPGMCRKGGRVLLFGVQTWNFDGISNFTRRYQIPFAYMRWDLKK